MVWGFDEMSLGERRRSFGIFAWRFAPEMVSSLRLLWLIGTLLCLFHRLTTRSPSSLLPLRPLPPPPSPPLPPPSPVYPAPPPPPPPSLNLSTQGFSAAHPSSPAVAPIKINTTSWSFKLSRWKHVVKISDSGVEEQMGRL